MTRVIVPTLIVLLTGTAPVLSEDSVAAANGGGALTIEKFMRGPIQKFFEADRDGDGKIAKDELEQVLREDFRSMDRNGDGVVDDRDFPRFGLSDPDEPVADDLAAERISY